MYYIILNKKKIQSLNISNNRINILYIRQHTSRRHTFPSNFTSNKASSHVEEVTPPPTHRYKIFHDCVAYVRVRDSKAKDTRLQLTRQLIRADGDWARVTRSTGINHSPGPITWQCSCPIVAIRCFLKEIVLSFALNLKKSLLTSYSLTV